jgi:hypothetical protein
MTLEDLQDRHASAREVCKMLSGERFDDSCLF